MKRATFIGLDVSKQMVAVALASDEAREPIRYFGRFPNTPDALRRLCKKLRQDGGALHFCHELAIWIRSSSAPRKGVDTGAT